jgi:hypothetical protein
MAFPTRKDKAVIPAKAESAGVARSTVTKGAVESLEVGALLKWHFDDLMQPLIKIDGVVFGKYTMIGAMRAGAERHRHVLGMSGGKRNPIREKVFQVFLISG